MSYRSRSGGDAGAASSSSSNGGYYPRSDSGYVRDNYASPSSPSSSASRHGGYDSRGGYDRYGGEHAGVYDRGGGYSSSSSRQPSAPQPPRYNDRAARDDLFQDSGYDPHTRRAQGYVPPSDRPPRPPAGGPAHDGYRRHPDQDQGYFYSQEDEEHAYRQVRDDIEAVKDQSVDTSRSALRRIRETEEVAAGSMRRLQEQGDKLTQVESRMTDADYHANRAENKTQELQRLNKNFIASTFTFSNPFTKAKRKEEKLKKELDERKKVEMEHEEQRKAQRENARNMGSTLDTVQGRHVPGQYGAGPAAAAPGSRSRTHYLEGEEDCEKEREIDNNLDEISSGLARLKMMGMAMGESIERSNQQIDRIDRRTDTVNDRVKRTEAKLGRMR